jgi:hypothetical protein
VLGDECSLAVVLFVCLILVVRGIFFFLRELEYIHDRAISLTFGRLGVALPEESSQSGIYRGTNFERRRQEC